MLRRIRSLPVHSLLRRHQVKPFSEKASEKVQHQVKPSKKTSSEKAGEIPWEDVPLDPRPPWVYSTTAGLRLILFPSIIFYAVFFADFGDREHVFMPPRRWLQRQREAFFTITPEERKLVEESTASEVHADTSTRDAASALPER